MSNATSSTPVVVQTDQFAGQLMLVHGDTHFFKVDKPPYSPSKVLPNLTRPQTFGRPPIHWVCVTVDAKDPNAFCGASGDGEAIIPSGPPRLMRAD